MSTSFLGRTSPDPDVAPISVEEYLRSSYEPDCDYVDGYLEERNVGDWEHSKLQKKILLYLEKHYGQQPFEVMQELRIRVSETRFRIPDLCVFPSDPKQRVPSTPPFLCIEILSPEDRMSRLEVRINDFLAMGVAYVWVIDPETRQCYSATGAEGLREVKSGLLRTEAPAIELPLAEIFS